MMRLVAGKRYVVDGTLMTVQEVNQDAARSAWYAFLVDDSGDIAFELIDEEGAWRHLDGGDVAEIKEV